MHYARQHTLLALALFATACCALTGTAGDDFKLEEGYTSLFNGTDLTGWKYPGTGGKPMDGQTETPDKRIEVKGGIIFVNAKDNKDKGGIKDLYTAKEFNTDYNLKLQFRAAPKADSGVHIRGFQLQVRDYPTVGPYSKVKNFKNGGWNDLDITVKGQVATTTVNGKAISAKDVLELIVKEGKPEAKLNGQSIPFSAIQCKQDSPALCVCNGEVIEKAMLVPLKGGIGLQAETGVFEFRRVRVKELP